VLIVDYCHSIIQTKLVAKGLPEEMMIIAKEKTQEIISAYELIKKKRGMR